jgi:hypothetical protein
MLAVGKTPRLSGACSERRNSISARELLGTLADKVTRGDAERVTRGYITIV